ncbi:hypothetical protein C2S51_003292 [Perilla frutescens var. frutescens]|nr:hypothetical protein C2S51_003292 [Perilla frutescens var. frutescens]
MDVYEATKIVMSRIQNLDPENASRIMGYILIQDQGEKEVIRLALCPDAVLLSCLNQAKAFLGLSPNAPSPKSLNPLPNYVRPNAFFPQNSPRILIPRNELQYSYSNPSSPASAPPFPRSSPRPISYAAVVNGSRSNTNVNDSNSDSGSPSLHFLGGNELGDEYLSGGGGGGGGGARQSEPSMSPSDPLVFPFGEDMSGHPNPFHRRSSSVNDAVFLSHLEEGGGGCRPCMYFAKGFCKNGSSCKFIHSDFVAGETAELGCPSSNAAASGVDAFLRMKALQRQRFALMVAGGHNHSSYNKCSNFVNDNQRCGPRNEFSPVGVGMAAAMASSSRQIYLTFPADSTFKDEDVSSYFSMFGPVQDVRIPYQPKRMFGFVTFVYPETVKQILAKGNPHYVCDSRVLVKPYKEKGKVADKKQFQLQHQHLEEGEYSSCLSPSTVDSKDPYDLPVGPRMLFDTQERLRRRLEHGVESQNAIDLQGLRMANLQLMDLRYQQQQNPLFLPSFPAGVSISSPRRTQFFTGENMVAFSDGANLDVLQEFDDWQETSIPVEADVNSGLEETESSSYNNGSNGNKDRHVNDDDSYLPESLEHILPDTLFASPTKSAAEHQPTFSLASSEAADHQHIL